MKSLFQRNAIEQNVLVPTAHHAVTPALKYRPNSSGASRIRTSITAETAERAGRSMTSCRTFLEHGRVNREELEKATDAYQKARESTGQRRVTWSSRIY